MKANKIKDERVIRQNQKIESQAYNIVMTILFISFAVKTLFLNEPFSSFAVEFGALCAGAGYQLIRSLLSGVDVANQQGKKYKPLQTSLFVGLVVAIVGGVSNYFRYGKFYQGSEVAMILPVMIIMFISGTLFCYVVLASVTNLNQRRQEKIQEELDRKEDE